MLDSLTTEINKKGTSRSHHVIIKRFSGDTFENILNELENQVVDKSAVSIFMPVI